MRKILTNRIVPLIMLAVILAFAGCAGAPVKPDQIIAGNYDYAKAHLTWLIKNEMKRNQVAGVISKLFTAMATMKLAEDGKVDIDRPLKNYLPQFAVRTRFADSGPITPRTIMTHHSGLPSSLAKGMWTSEAPARLLDRLKDEYTAYPTNYVLAYSNIGVALLGLMIEQVSHTDFCEYVDQAILGPIGMQQSSFKKTAVVEMLLSKGYRNGKEMDQVPLRDVAAGSMYSTVLDLSRFMSAMFRGGEGVNGRVLAQATLERM